MNHWKKIINLFYIKRLPNLQLNGSLKVQLIIHKVIFVQSFQIEFDVMEIRSKNNFTKNYKKEVEVGLRI